jgi:hypothetical protein
MVPSYEFYLRTYNSYTMETILYATTKEVKSFLKEKEKPKTKK